MASILSAGTTTATGLNFSADTTGILQLASNNGTVGLTMDTSQNVGIGTSSPSKKLEVANSDALIYGITVGRGAGAVATNTTVGTSALVSNTSGANNIAIGYQAGFQNTTGGNHVFVGFQAGYSNQTNGNIVAVGSSAGYSNTIGSGTYVGYQAGQYNTTGPYNTFVGGNSGYLTTTGSYNSAFGSDSLRSNTTGANNTAIGYQAGYSNTTGVQNFFGGLQAGYTNSTGNLNVFIGNLAGYTSNVNGDAKNIAIGDRAGYLLTTGTVNTLVGAGAGYNITTGSKNSILGGYNGNQGGLDIRTASNYIVLSDGDGNPRGIFDNSGNLLVGVLAPLNGSRFNTVATGSAIAGGFKNDNASYQTIQVWNAATSGTRYLIQFSAGTGGTSVGLVTTDGTNTTYGTSSDYRLKENIQPMTGALEKVAQLNPCTYTWKESGTLGQGFVAHELQAVVPDAVVGEKDAVNEDGSIKPQNIDTSFLVATLTAAIQEQQALITQLQADVAALKGAA